MKRMLAVFSLGLLLTGAMLPAEETPVPAPIPDGMGTKVEIGSTVDMSGVDRSYLDAPDIVNFRSDPWIWIISQVVMSPDGGQVYFGGSSDGNIYAVPSAGGMPRLVFESYQIHSFEGKRYVVNQGLCDLVGIAADGRYLFFIQIKYGGVTITNGGTGYTFLSDGKRALMRLDLQTGEVRTIFEGAEIAVMSMSGKYVAGVDTGRNRYVIDTDSLEKWTLPITTYPSGFIGDEYLFYSQADANGKKQLFRIPVRGGDPEQVTRIGDGLELGATPNCSPDGNWILFTRGTGEVYSNSITLPGGGARSYTKEVKKLCALDLRSGVVSDVLPMSKTVDPRRAQFLSGGNRFIYILENAEGAGFHQEWSIYIKDFDPASLNPEEPVAVEDAAPVAFALTGNYPNPFNPSTTIGFTLPAPGATELTIYDVTGRKVRELVSGALPAGRHEITWDGRDEAGAAVSSGVYLSRLRMGALSATGRMLLVK